MANKEKPYNKDHVVENFARRIGSTKQDAEQILAIFFDMTRDYIYEYGMFHYKSELQIDTDFVPTHKKQLPNGDIVTVPDRNRLKVKLMENYKKMLK
jgi:hypothetical protein